MNFIYLSAILGTVERKYSESAFSFGFQRANRTLTLRC